MSAVLAIRNPLGVNLLVESGIAGTEAAGNMVASWLQKNPMYRVATELELTGFVYEVTVERVGTEHVVSVHNSDGSTTRTAYSRSNVKDAVAHYTQLIADGKRATITNNEA